MSKALRNFIIGDLHGCLVEFKELLDKINYNPLNDRVILCGDLIDRGEDSVGCVKLARELDLECVLGNHEQRFLKWFKGNKYLDPYPHYTQFSDDDVDFINRMPLYLKLDDNSYVVHAGVKNYLPIDKQKKDDLLYLRYTDENRKFISIKKIVKEGAEELGAKFWTEFGPFGYNVVYGHQVHSEEEARVDSFSDGTSCYGIDLGCCFGGNLAALHWESKEIIKVKAKKTYYKSYKDTDE
jgi:hypothetical protein